MAKGIESVRSGKVHLGLTGSLGAFFQRLRKISLQERSCALPCEMLAYALPYEASRTIRAMKYEFECCRSEALVEARRMSTRC